MVAALPALLCQHLCCCRSAASDSCPNTCCTAVLLVCLQLPPSYFWELQYRPILPSQPLGEWQEVEVRSGLLSEQVTGLSPGTKYAFRWAAGGLLEGGESGGAYGVCLSAEHCRECRECRFLPHPQQRGVGGLAALQFMLCMWVWQAVVGS